jgi:hypothetical protein
MKKSKITERVLALFLIVPALVLFSLGILSSGFRIEAANHWLDVLLKQPWGGPVFSPFVVLGGPALVMLFNLKKVLKFHARSESGEFVVIVSLKQLTGNLVVAAVGGFLIAAFLSYALIENFKIVSR